MFLNAIRVACITLNLFAASAAFAQSDHHFVAPNELNPELSKPILNQAMQKGAYIAVGTERGFMGAAMSPNATYLLLVDRDPLAAQYNRINADLLKYSVSRADYLEMRLKPNFEQWRSAARGHLSQLNESNFRWWVENLENEDPQLRLFHQPPATAPYSAFKDSNYLYDKALFAKIQKMAKANRIQVMQSSLELNPFTTEIKNLYYQDIFVNVIDISNAHYPQYAGTPMINQMLTRLRNEQILKPQSVVMLTHFTKSRYYKDGVPSNSYAANHKAIDWQYHGYTAERLEKDGKIALPPEWRNYDPPYPMNRHSTFNQEIADRYPFKPAKRNCLNVLLDWFQ